MAKIYRGHVIEVWAPAGFDKKGNRLVKPRPVVVLQNVAKSDNMVTVYCTTQNNGDDINNIFVEAGTDEAIQMGLKKSTYIRPGAILNLDIKSFKRILGRCPLMDRIQAIIEANNLNA